MLNILKMAGFPEFLYGTYPIPFYICNIERYR